MPPDLVDMWIYLHRLFRNIRYSRLLDKNILYKLTANTHIFKRLVVLAMPYTCTAVTHLWICSYVRGVLTGWYDNNACTSLWLRYYGYAIKNIFRFISVPLPSLPRLAPVPYLPGPNYEQSWMIVQVW